ncbi:MAG: hypothetical protein V1810_00120 [Candidatus Beckwithbacteria bacterium]
MTEVTPSTSPNLEVLDKLNDDWADRLNSLFIPYLAELSKKKPMKIIETQFYPDPSRDGFRTASLHWEGQGKYKLDLAHEKSVVRGERFATGEHRGILLKQNGKGLVITGVEYIVNENLEDIPEADLQTTVNTWLLNWLTTTSKG